MFDCVFTCCKGIMKQYVNHGAKTVFHLLPGYSPELNNIIVCENSDEYECDISIACTQLYENDNREIQQYISLARQMHSP